VKSKTHTVRESFDDVKIGVHLACIEFDRVTAYVHDPNADCDADGNRGRAVDYIDEDYAERITVQFDEDREALPLASLSTFHQKEVSGAIDAYLERVPPTPPEDEEPDDDREDDDDCD
jgi:hypothetical protein